MPYELKTVAKKTSAVFGVWILFTLFDLIGVRDWEFVVENATSDRFLVNYSLTALAFLFLFFIISSFLLSGPGKRAIAYLILTIPLVIQLSYFRIYRKFVSAFGFRAFSEDPGMVFDLWIHNLSIVRILLACGVTLGTLYLLRKINARFNRITLGVSAFVCVTVMTLMTLSWYSVPVYQNSVFAYAGSFLEMLKQKSYSTFKINKPRITVTPSDRNRPNIIYIIGESTVLSHMGVFGYPRNTTPGLTKLEREGKIVTFDNCVSIGIQTRLSVPYMLTGLEGIDPKGYIYTYPTVFNYAKALGYSTAFITAQDFSWGGLKDLLIDKDVDDFENGTNFNPNLSVHKGANDLDVLDRAILPYIDTTKNPFLLVIQMDGSHYPFSEHSEPKYKVFMPEESPNCVNAFDNSVVYSDLFLTRLIETVRKKNPDCWVFFSPDHGQNLGGKNGLFNDSFSSDVIHNPLIISPPENALRTISTHRHAPLSQSDIVPTILEIMGIKPVKPMDGYSILGKIPSDRLRVCSTYMPTFHNVPESLLIFSDMSYYFVDLERKSVVLNDGKTTKQFTDINPKYQEIFLRRM